MKAFYFSIADKRLAHGDGRKIKPGVTHKVKGPLELCWRGLHASERVIDALRYAPGPYLWVVELGGEILHGGDKVCASERKYLAGFDASEVLRHFARRQAQINVERLEPYCSASDYALIVRWLETGDEAIMEAASSAAWASAASAEAAAEAAWAAAEAAEAAEAASDAASDAAWAAAWAARAAATSAWSAANDMLMSMLPSRIVEAYRS